MNIYVTSEQIGLQGYWITDILAGINKEALKKNLNVTDYAGEDLELNDEFTRPIVLAVGYSSKWMESICNQMRSYGVQPVLVNAGQDTYTETLDSVGFVSFGYKKAMHRVIHYLSSNKRNRIAFFGAHGDTHSDSVKVTEFLNACDYFKLFCSKADVYGGNSLKECAEELKMNLAKYNAVVCSSDAAAIFLIKQFEEIGIKVPEDVFVVGFGNSQVAAAITPSVTSVDCNYVELGRQAVKLHQFLQKNGDTDSASISVDCRFIERASTGFIKSRRMLVKSRHDGNMPLYDADPDVMKVLQAEELLRMWDDIDRSIIDGLLQDKTIVAIAEGLFISVSAVKYRIKKMLTATNLQNKDDLVSVIKKYNVL